MRAFSRSKSENADNWHPIYESPLRETCPWLGILNKEKFPLNNGVLSADVQTCMKERTRSHDSIAGGWKLVGTSGARAPSRGALELTGPTVQWLLVSVPRIKRPERNDDHWPPPSAEVKNVWSYTSAPPYASMAWAERQLNVQNFVRMRSGFAWPKLAAFSNAQP